MRKMASKPGPSGMSRNEAYSLPQKWGGRDCLIKVDVEVVQAMKAEIGGEALLAFTDAEFSIWAQTVYDSLHIVKLSFQNVWDVFSSMHSLMYPL